MCGLHAYKKNNDKSTNATKCFVERFLPADSKRNPLGCLCVIINLIDTWPNALETKNTCRYCAYQEKIKEIFKDSY